MGADNFGRERPGATAAAPFEEPPRKAVGVGEYEESPLPAVRENEVQDLVLSLLQQEAPASKRPSAPPRGLRAPHSAACDEAGRRLSVPTNTCRAKACINLANAGSPQQAAPAPFAPQKTAMKDLEKGGDPRLEQLLGGGRRRARTGSQGCRRSSAAAGSLLGRYSRCLLLMATYAVADAGKMILVRWANQGRSADDRFEPASMLFVQLTISLVVALSASAVQMGTSGVLMGIQPASVAQCLPVSLLFFISKASTVAALARLDAGTVKLSSQAILPVTALLSVRMLAGRRYSQRQWMCISAIGLFTLAFNLVQLEAVGSGAGEFLERDEHVQVRMAGLFFCVVVVLSNALGSIIGERFLKSYKGKMPVAVLKAQLEVAELTVVLLSLMLASGMRARLWFAGWDHRVLICALGWVPSSWMSTLITSRFNTVVKNVLQCVSALVTYFLVFPGDTHTDARPAVSTLLALSIIISAFVFNL